ncbi:MAG: PilZ domain-containing protein [Cyanobacteriota bacterium]
MADTDSPDGEIRRTSERKMLPLGMPANMRLPSGGRIVMSLRDLSEGGLCAMRNGKLPVQEGDRVELELIDYDHGPRLDVQGVVRWVKTGRFSTTIGLQFEHEGLDVESFLAEHRHQQESDT